jgi:hypothetical protein
MRSQNPGTQYQPTFSQPGASQGSLPRYDETEEEVPDNVDQVDELYCQYQSKVVGLQYYKGKP